MEKKVSPYSLAVHAGDRKRPSGNQPAWVPVTIPIHTAASYFYNDMEDLDRVFGNEMPGQSYGRYGNPTSDALEELVTTLEGGAGALACATGMAAIHMALSTALIDRRRSIVASHQLYGATLGMLAKVFEPAGVEVTYVDFCDDSAVTAAIEKNRPGAILMESATNPLVRIPALDRVAALARAADAPLIVDNTFATPLIVRPFEFGASFVVHSLTKYLSGHGDVMGGIVIADEENLAPLRALSRTVGFTLGPFECYLAMRGIKTFPLRMERQCANACRVASWLATHPRVERVYFTGDPAHPDAATIRRVFPADLYGAIVSFEIRDAGKEEIFAFMDRLKMVVRATSLGDVHTMMLYPTMSSHREISPKHSERMGIRDNLVRLSLGIEAAEDIMADLAQALG